MADSVTEILLRARGDFSDLTGKISSLRKEFQNLKLPKDITANLEKGFNRLDPILKSYQKQLDKGFKTKTDLKNFEATRHELDAIFSDITSEIQKVNGQPVQLKADLKEIEALDKRLNKLGEDLQKKLNNISIDKGNKVTQGLDKIVESTKKASTIKPMTIKAQALFDTQDFAAYNSEIDKMQNKILSLSNKTGAKIDLARALGFKGETFTKEGEAITSQIEKVDTLIKNFFNNLKVSDHAIGGLEKTNTEIVQTGEALNRVKTDSLKKGVQALSDFGTNAQQASQQAKGLGDSIDDAASSSVRMADELQQLKTSTQYFFSLRNMLNLFKRGVQEAVDVIKELDAAMTETAVVTDFSVGDMWKKLPEYTANANALGASVKDMYKATTLYYQQGLETDAAMGIANETMKMARIGGLEAADATDKMTAALRGFNMEINETSAQRVNDVYSNLAAKTASNTEELGTAMQRTASIAASAGMSFEGTAAFLAQAIETTREPAENLGTAMKTIVARFTELKKNPLEIAEVDGEEVDYNKVDTALKSIGVSLKDANGQFRNLDQVFLDIAQRWDGLTQTQQRYVATQAAGSRQQSRFIAMMSNYDRTVQLMDYANNSAGASNEQFGKTMESLEAKLNKLKNAWQQFEMGIANNSFIKTAVDGLTGFLNITNKIIDKLSLGSGAIKSFLSIFAAFTGLKIAGRGANALIGGLGGLVDPRSSVKEGLRTGLFGQGKNAAQAKAISDPIVTAVNRIYGAITGKQATTNQTTQNTTADFKSFKNANTEMRNFLGSIKANDSFSISEAYGKISKLDDRQQKAVLQQLPGLQLSLQKNGINFDTAGLSESASKLINTFKNEINQGLKDKAVDSQGVLQLFGTPDNFKKGMAARGPEYVKAAEEVLNSGIDKAKIQDEALNAKIAERDLLGAKWSDDQILEMAQKEANKKIKSLQTDNLQKSIKGTASAGMQAANDIASVGQAAIIAGQGVAQLGMQLSNAGFEQAGQAVTNLGYQISSLGQIAISVGSVVGKISDAGGIGALVTAHPAITAIIAAVAVLGSALALASAHFKKIKEAGEEVTKTFSETNKVTEDNIAKLKSYQSEFATLSKGVDSNGYNINLDDAQYQRYLEIVDDIATINPEIVEGYNAQGHAIINNNKALAETLAKQEEIKKNTLDTYTSEKSLQKLIDARNINKDYKNIQTQENGVSMGYGHGNEGRPHSIGKATPLAGDVSSIADKLRLVQGTDALGNTIRINDEMLQKYGIESLDALVSGEEQAVKNFVKHRQQIEAELNNSGFELSKSITKGFDKLGKDADAFDEAIKPVYDNLLANISNSKVFESIAPEFREALNMGLKDLASQDLSASEMSKEANNMAARFANLTTGSGKYADALKIVEKAQDNFAATLNETQYKANVQPAIDDLTRLKEEALEEGTAYGDALAEYLENQIEKISRFTEEGSISLSEALNTATNEIAAAEGAYDSFKEATKSDFSTGAESMKSIFDEITKETDGIALHMEGKGDKAFWTGAESLFGTDTLVNKTPEQVKKMFDRIEPMLQEGRAGFDAFWRDVFSSENVEKLKGIEGVDIDPENWMLNWDDNVNPDVFHEMAQALGMSDEFLTSMLNKGRQFGAIDFMDTNDVRKALSTDAAAVKGTSTTTVQGQNGPEQVVDMFVKGDYIRSALADAGMVTPQDQQEAIDRLATQGVHIIKDPEQISSDDLKGMGISDMKSLIQTLGDTGQYTKDEIEAYAEKLGDYTPEDFADGYQKYLDAQEHPEIEPIQSIQSTVQQIASILASQRIEEGHLDNTDTSKAFQRSVYGEANVRDTKAQAFAVGRNEQGNVMTAEQYRINLADLQNAAIEAQRYIDALSSGMENASGQDLENMKAEKASMEATLSYLQDQISQGQQVWAEKYAQQQYDLAYQSAIDAGENAKTAQEEANTVKQDALKQAQELIQATQEGLTDGLNTTDTSRVKGAATESAKKYTDTGTGSSANITSSTITKGVEFVTKGVEEATKNIDTVDSKADKGATHTTEFKTSGEKETEGAIKKVTDAGTGSKTVKVGASVDTSGAKKAASTIGGMTAKIGVTIKDNATAAAEKVRKGIDRKSASIDIKPNYTGNWTKTVTVREQKAATGVNNKIVTPHVPIFGSLAKGTKKGKLGPRNQGGVTLTGEEGYEIAWLPSEGRSMILGANGPQMIDLPSDATVYNHEQSVDILRKRQTIDAGSLPSGNAKYKPSDGGSSKKSKKKTSKKSKKSKKKSSSKDSKETINNWSIEEAVRYNIDQSLASITEEISLRTKDIEKNLEKIGTTYNDIVGTTQTQISALQEVKNYNQQLLDSYHRQLADYRSRQAIVSYTDSKGESQQKKINIADYLNIDGSVNTSAIAAAGGREVQEAIYKEINSAKSIIDGINNATKAIKDAEDQIADLGKKISEAFYQWENELTEVYDLTQRINNEVSFTNRFTSQIELELSKLGAGFGDTAESIENARKVLLRNNKTIKDQIANQQQMIAARQRELQSALSYQDELDKLNKFRTQTNVDAATKQANIDWAQGLANGAMLGNKYVKNLFKDIDGSIQYEIDWEQFNADNEVNPYSKTDYEAIKKYLDDLNSASTEFNDAIKDQTDFIKQTYDALKEYQDYVADMEDTLIKGVEEQIKEAKDNAKQLSDSITSALKDLLDEVKRKLDERRKQEDNAKTERDISQKQQRLAMLRADTAGGHQVEIAQLEKEIADSQQSYQRTLEDQLLDRLQQQADEASEQRERQIELMQAGNQIDAATNKELVDMWLKDPEKYKEEIKAAWLEAQGYDEKGEARQYVLENQFESDFAQLVTAVEESNFKDSFNALTADTNSLAALLNELTNGQLGRQDELAHSTNALLDVTDRNTTSILTEMQKQNSAAMLKAKGADAATLKTLGYTAQQMLEGNYTPEELKEAGYTAKELAEGGITDVGALKSAGYGAKDIKDANVGNASNFKEAGFTAEELKDLFSLDELVDALFDAKALKNAGYDVNALKGAGFGIQQLKDAGFTLPQLKSAFSATEFGADGISYDDAKAAGYGLNDLKPVLEYASQAQQEQAAIDAAAAAAAAAARVGNGNPYGAASQTSGKINKGDKGNQVRSIQWALKQMGYYPHTIDGDFGNNTKKAVKAFQKATGITQDGVVGPNTRKAFAAKGYKTGGLADYTGPAWLDGTPSKPELVLNPTDTKNFLALRDVLSSAMKSTSAVTNSYGGDVMYDINIHVDKIEKDYDVDRVVDKVKKEITKGAGYRNVTQVRNFK